MANTQRRMIHLKIWTSEQFGKLSDKAKLLYVGLITLADDDGKLRGNPAYLRGQIFPYDESLSVTDVLQVRNEIEKSGLITLFSIDNFEYIEHPKWKEYQIIRRDLYKPSQLPTRNETVTKPLRNRTLSQVKLSKDKLIPETSSGEVAELIKAFEGINPASKQFYSRPPQRKACRELIDAYTFERVRSVIEKTLPRTNGLPFFPTITTPMQLRDKWISLESAVRKYQAEKKAGGEKYKVAFKS